MKVLDRIESIDSKNKKAWDLVRTQPNEAIRLAEEALEESVQKKYEAGEVWAIAVFGAANVWLGDYDLALELTFEALERFTSIAEKEGIILTNYNLAIVFYFLGEYEKQVEYSEKSLEVAEEVNHLDGIANALNGIGSAHYTFGDPNEALPYLQKALEVAEKIQAKAIIARIYDGLGQSNYLLKNYPKAIEFKLKTLELFSETEESQIIAYAHEGLGEIYVETAEYEKALDHYRKSVFYRKKLNFKLGIGQSTLKIADLQLKTDKLDEALRYFKSALVIGEEIESDDLSLSAHEGLSRIYEKQGNLPLFSRHYKAYHQIKVESLEKKEGKKLKAIELKGKFDQIQKEKEELEKKNQQLRTYFEDVRTLSSIGNQITSTHDLEGIFDIIYDRINSLMEANGIFIGICNNKKNTLDVPLALDNGIRDKYFEYSLDDYHSQLPVYAVKINEDIHINDYENEIQNYLEGSEKFIHNAPNSVVIILLKVNESTIGVLLAQSQKKNAFSKHQFNILKSFASYLAIAIDNASLYREMDKKIEERTREVEESHKVSEKLNEIGQTLISSLDFDNVFQQLYTYVNEMMDATIFSVRLYDQEKQCIHYTYEIEKGKMIEPVSVPMSKKENLSVWCIENNEAIFINDSKREYQQYVKDIDVVVGEMSNSVIMYPLRKGDEVLGLISVQSFQKHAYSNYHLIIVKTLAHYTTIALDNARSFELMEVKVQERTSEIQKQSEEIKKSYKNTKILSEIGQEISRELSSVDIIAKVYESINNLMSAPVFGIGLHREDKNDLFFSGAMENGDQLKDFSFSLNQDKIGNISFLENRSILINDWLNEYTDYLKEDYDVITGNAPDSLIYLPLNTKEKTIGVLSVQSFEKNCYTEYHLNILSSLSVYISAALENARLYHNMEEMVVERTQELQQSYKNTETLNDIGRELISTLDFEDVFEQLYQNVNKLMDATVFGIRLINQEKERVEYIYEYENGKRLVPIYVPLSSDANLSVWCIKNDREIIADDIMIEAERYTNMPPQVIEGEMTHSVIFYPMRSPSTQKVLGAISVQSFEKGAYTDYHLNIVKSLAQYVVIAFENASRYEIMEEQVRERTSEIKTTFENTKLLSKIGRDITSQITVEKIIEVVYDSINRLMDAEGFGIGIYDENSHKITFPGYIESGERLADIDYDLNVEKERLSSVCFLDDREIKIDNLEEEYSLYMKSYLPPLKGEACLSIIYLPIKSKNKKIGVITVQSFKQNAYSDYHFDIMKTLGIYAGIALENASLYANMEERVKERTSEIEKAHQDTKLIAQISKDISESLNVETIISRVYENINTVMDASCFGIGIYNDETKEIHMPGFIEKSERLEGVIFDTKDPNRLASWCFNNRKEIMVADYANEYNRYIELTQAPVSGEDTSSILYLPLELKDKVVGVMTVQSFDKNAYTDYHLDILRGLATNIAAAIENALLYESLEDKVNERTLELLQQKEIIEEKNKSITDSIIYAKRIQDATLPDLALIRSYLEQSFVLFKPKDIVSGDFYWIEKVGNTILFAVVDCTGHGVPGAFLSLIGHNALNQIVNELKIIEPGKILDELNRKVHKTLQNSLEKNSIKDGMDMAICSLNLDTNILSFAGAYNPLYMIRDSNITVVKGDKMAIGSTIAEKAQFKTEEIQLKEGDAIYLFSDGYADQFGGPKGKKFKYSKFRDLLVSISEKDVDEQHEILVETMKIWQGELEQIDDLCVIGYKI